MKNSFIFAFLLIFYSAGCNCERKYKLENVQNIRIASQLSKPIAIYDTLYVRHYDDGYYWKGYIGIRADIDNEYRCVLESLYKPKKNTGDPLVRQDNGYKVMGCCDFYQNLHEKFPNAKKANYPLIARGGECPIKKAEYDVNRTRIIDIFDAALPDDPKKGYWEILLRYYDTYGRVNGGLRLTADVV